MDESPFPSDRAFAVSALRNRINRTQEQAERQKRTRLELWWPTAVGRGDSF